MCILFGLNPSCQLMCCSCGRVQMCLEHSQHKKGHRNEILCENHRERQFVSCVNKPNLRRFSQPHLASGQKPQRFQLLERLDRLKLTSL